MSFFQNGQPGSFDPGYSADDVNRAFAQNDEQYTKPNMVSAGGDMHGISGFSIPAMNFDKDQRQYVGGETVNDYTTEVLHPNVLLSHRTLRGLRVLAAYMLGLPEQVPDDEGEGLAYNIEKRHIRETVDLPDAFVFAWGDGEYGKLGQQSTDTLHVPYLLSTMQTMPIRMCALGKNHSLFL